MTRLKDWLQISTIGFAQRQADRPPAHLMKEAVQNALDAVEGLKGGCVDITIKPEKLGRKIYVRLTVLDNGPGIANPEDLRTVFSTGKTDSFLLRGRLGQGIKELICVCKKADVRSGPYAMAFLMDKGQRVCDVDADLPHNKGTSISLWMPWKPDVIPELERYLHSFVVPKDVKMLINQRTAAGTKLPVAHEIDVDLKTELFQDGRWKRRDRPGKVQLIAPFPGETPKIYELGIPIQEIDWTQPFHVNVLMRVPLNPRRDAVAAGYLKELYGQILRCGRSRTRPEPNRH